MTDNNNFIKHLITKTTTKTTTASVKPELPFDTLFNTFQLPPNYHHQQHYTNPPYTQTTTVQKQNNPPIDNIKNESPLQHTPNYPAKKPEIESQEQINTPKRQTVNNQNSTEKKVKQAIQTDVVESFEFDTLKNTTANHQKRRADKQPSEDILQDYASIKFESTTKSSKDTSTHLLTNTQNVASDKVQNESRSQSTLSQSKIQTHDLKPQGQTNSSKKTTPNSNPTIENRPKSQSQKNLTKKQPVNDNLIEEKVKQDLQNVDDINASFLSDVQKSDVVDQNVTVKQPHVNVIPDSVSVSAESIIENKLPDTSLYLSPDEQNVALNATQNEFQSSPQPNYSKIKQQNLKPQGQTNSSKRKRVEPTEEATPHDQMMREPFTVDVVSDSIDARVDSVIENKSITQNFPFNEQNFSPKESTEPVSASEDQNPDSLYQPKATLRRIQEKKQTKIDTTDITKEEDTLSPNNDIPTERMPADIIEPEVNPVTETIIKPHSITIFNENHSVSSVDDVVEPPLENISTNFNAKKSPAASTVVPEIKNEFLNPITKASNEASQASLSLDVRPEPLNHIHSSVQQAIQMTLNKNISSKPLKTTNPVADDYDENQPENPQITDPPHRTSVFTPKPLVSQDPPSKIAALTPIIQDPDGNSGKFIKANLPKPVLPVNNVFSKPQMQKEMENTVTIHIGRIEVHAVREQERSVSRPREPALSLGDYLKQRMERDYHE